MSSEAVSGIGVHNVPSASFPRARARGGLSAVDYLTLFLIGLVVVLVSLPRLRRFALRENELDAIALLEDLGHDMSEFGEGLPASGIVALLASNPRHEDRFEDLEVLPGGLLRRHGYLFDAEERAPGVWVLRAWPWGYGHTGLGSFVFSPGEGLLGNENAGGLCDGPGRPPDSEEAQTGRAGWCALKR
jgi:hypothetical protein